MKKTFAVALSLMLVLLLVPSVVLAGEGNGLPDEATGQHYNLNIIGVQNPKKADMDGSNGHVIFVDLSGHSKIELMEAPEGESFKVLDANGTDGSPAQFQLPDPGLDPYNVDYPEGKDTISDYSVFVRPLGRPGGWSTITTCAELLDSDFAGLLSGKFVSVLNKAGYYGGYASVEQVGQDITMRTKGKSLFTNVTAELLTIVFKVEVDISEEGEDPEIIVEYIRVPIFDDIIQGEYWDYENNNLKLLQVRFYPCGTDVSEGDPDLK
jgi:hypothetical protein